MLYKLLCFSALVGACSGFAPAPVVPRSAVMGQRAGAVFMQETEEKTDAAAEATAAPPAPPSVEYAESLPFLVKRPQLKGYVGDVGFDPLGFSEILPMDWLREAELKHCRVSMLAFVGMIFTDFYTLPGYEFTTLEAHDAGVANGSMSQLLLWLGLLEFFSFIAVDQMLRGSGREPGDYGFDPIGFISDPAKKEEMQMKELANGRLAMFAFGGAVTQAVLTGNTFPWLYSQ
jgi:light-harvesting complex I chlorophyll a/b binding protein 1